MKELTDPAFIAQLAALVAAITALVKIFVVDRTTKENNAVVKNVREQTNGNMQVLKEQVDSLRRHIALLEQAARLHESPAAPDAPPDTPRIVP